MGPRSAGLARLLEVNTWPIRRFDAGHQVNVCLTTKKDRRNEATALFAIGTVGYWPTTQLQICDAAAICDASASPAALALVPVPVAAVVDGSFIPSIVVQSFVT